MATAVKKHGAFQFGKAGALVAASIGVAAMLMAGTISYVMYDRDLAYRYAVNRIINASGVLSEFVDKAISGVETMLREGRREVVESGGKINPGSLQRKLTDISTGVSGVTSVFTLNADGQVTANSRALNLASTSFADRTYFTEPLRGEPERLHVSETLMNRIQGQWQFFASRLIAMPDGRRAGVIVASVDTRMFEDLLGSYRPDPDIVTGLYTNHFRLIARSPSEPNLFGTTLTEVPLIAAYIKAPRNPMALIGPCPDERQECLNVVRQVAGQPLFLSISVPTTRVFAEWRTHSRILLSLAGMMSAFIVFVGVAGARGLRRQDEVSSLLDTMFSQTPASIAISNVNGGVIKSNDNWLALINLFAVPQAFRDDVFKSLRHAVIAGGGAGISGDLANTLRDLHLASIGLKGQVNLELHHMREDEDRHFSVEITRIQLSRRESSEGFAILVVDISRQRTLELRLRSQLVQDSQTGLPNREGFIAELDARLATADGDDCLFAFDIVGLAELKDIRGFEVSDKAFSAVGTQVARLCERGCIAGRVDSEKFCVFVQGEGMGATVEQRLQTMIYQLSHEYPLSGDSFSVRMTVGGARVADGGRNPEKLIQAAEMAHGVAKRRGLASFAFFNAQVQADAQDRVQLYEALQRALIAGEFELEYQPKVHLVTGEIIGAEALLRWRHPELGLQPPARFIPVAEESGLIVPLGNWVIRDVVRFLRQWQDEGRSRLVPISLNVSNAQFDRDAVDSTLAEELRAAGLPPGLLTIELTESVFSLDVTETVRKINRIRDLGLKVSLDDFGTGYSSLSYLNLMNFDELKIDGSFVRKIHSDVVSRSIVDMTLRLAHTLDVSVTAEGVETEDQRQALVALGCKAGQGFLFSKSLPPEEFKSLVIHRRRLKPMRT